MQRGHGQSGLQSLQAMRGTFDMFLKRNFFKNKTAGVQPVTWLQTKKTLVGLIVDSAELASVIAVKDNNYEPVSTQLAALTDCSRCLQAVFEFMGIHLGGTRFKGEIVRLLAELTRKKFSAAAVQEMRLHTRIRFQRTLVFKRFFTTKVILLFVNLTPGA